MLKNFVTACYIPVRNFFENVLYKLILFSNFKNNQIKGKCDSLLLCAFT